MYVNGKLKTRQMMGLKIEDEEAIPEDRETADT